MSTSPHDRTTLALIAAFGLGATCVAAGQERTSPDPRRTPVVEAYERARDSVVNIAAVEQVVVERWGRGLFGDIFRMPSEQSQRSVGSGFIIHPDGYIVTNAHVVARADRLTVTLADGTAYPGEVFTVDRARDLAIVKIKPDRPLHPITLGTSSDLMIAETTIAVGNPVGLKNTVTVGVLSALHRELDLGGSVVYRDVIQTDASINPGNSGGPLLNIKGELIGINTAIRTDAQNIGFAIPVDQLSEMLPDMFDVEKLNDVELGLRVSGRQPGAVVSVARGTPAFRAGLHKGDIITAVAGRPVKRPVDFYVELLKRRAGETVPFEVRRGKKKIHTRLELAPRPKPDGVVLARKRLGIEIAKLDPDVARRIGWQRSEGVIVLALTPNGPADVIGALPGDLIVSLDGYAVRNMDQVGTILRGIDPGDMVDVGIRRVMRNTIYEVEGRLRAR